MTPCANGRRTGHRPSIRWPSVLAIVLVVGACAPRPVPVAHSEPSPAPPATADLPLATLPDGATVELELALTPDETERGLMFRPSLPAGRGMLFVFKETRPLSFWMKNTWVPLDIVFLDEHGVVLHVEADAQPCSAEPCPRFVSERPARAVLEIVAGSVRRHGLVEGARPRFSHVPGFPLSP